MKHIAQLSFLKVNFNVKFSFYGLERSNQKRSRDNMLKYALKFENIEAKIRTVKARLEALKEDGLTLHQTGIHFLKHKQWSSLQLLAALSARLEKLKLRRKALVQEMASAVEVIDELD